MTKLGILVIAVAIAATACGGNSMEPTVSLADAQARLQKDIHDAATAVFPQGFTLEDQGPSPQNCTDSVGKTDGQVNMGMGFWVNGIERARNDEYFDALKNWWSTHGWSSKTDSRPKDMFINATRDGYLMGLGSSVDGRLTIEGTTPCVWRNGTPEPKG